MNYQVLKSMIDNLIQSYRCNECNNTISEKDIDIIWAAWNSVNIDVFCPNCKRHAMIKSQVLQMDITNLFWLKNNSLNFNNPIKDKEMIELSKELKNKNLNVKDLFSDDK